MKATAKIMEIAEDYNDVLVVSGDSNVIIYFEHWESTAVIFIENDLNLPIVREIDSKFGRDTAQYLGRNVSYRQPQLATNGW